VGVYIINYKIKDSFRQVIPILVWYLYDDCETLFIRISCNWKSIKLLHHYSLLYYKNCIKSYQSSIVIVKGDIFHRAQKSFEPIRTRTYEPMCQETNCLCHLLEPVLEPLLEFSLLIWICWMMIIILLLINIFHHIPSGTS